MDALKTLGQDRLDSQQQGPFRCPVTARPRPVLLAGDDNQWRPLLFILDGSIENRRLPAIGKLAGKATLDACDQFVLQADVGEGASHHDFMIAAPRTV